jgi:hypothetical protein
VVRARYVRTFGFGVEVGQGQKWLFLSSGSEERLWRFYRYPRAYLDEHPNYLASQPSKKWFFNLDFTPEASEQELQRAFDFNLWCLTRLGRCDQIREIMPSAWADYEEMLRVARSEEQHPAPCTEQTYERLARDSDVVSIVEVRRVQHPPTPHDLSEERLVEYRYVRHLKDPPSPPATRVWHVVDPGGGSAKANQGGVPLGLFTPGRHLILFLWGNIPPDLPADRDCGVAAVTPERLARIERAIAVQKERLALLK